MKASKTLTIVVLILTLMFTSIYAIKSNKDIALITNTAQEKNESLTTEEQKTDDFISSLLPYYEESLANITEEDFLNAQKPPQEDESIKFCIVTSSYNNVKYASQQLNSVFKQNYHSWRFFYVDDISNDGTGEAVAKIKNDSKLSDDKFHLVRRQNKSGSTAQTVYEAAHGFCQDNEVIVILDGDDMLATTAVLSKLSDVYKDGKTWVTHGQFIRYPNGTIAKDFRNEISEKDWDNARISGPWSFSHLRTAYTWLYKKINPEDIKYNGEFMTIVTDLALTYPLIEMAGKERVTFIKDIMYIYRVHPRNEGSVNREFQAKMNGYIRNLPRYEQLD